LVVVESDAMKAVVDEVAACAECELPAVIEGERGTGRELLARLIHHAGPRRGRNFVAIEADAWPEPLAHDHIPQPAGGPLDQAQGGTLLVKNLCALPSASQGQLATALRRRGHGDPRVSIDVRLVGACSSDLDSFVEAGVFDAELYEHMTARRIQVPPLRDRPVDIPPLASHFVRSFGDEIGRTRMTLSTRAFDRLVKYPWPGNVAELKDLARRLVVRSKKSLIEADDVDGALPVVAERIPVEELSLEDLVRAKLAIFLRRIDGYPMTGLYDDLLQRIERPLFSLVMEHTGGNQLRAAEILGLNRNTLRRKLAEHGLRAPARRAGRRRTSTVEAARAAK
jgi:two-component system, NtrC family, nitrogen regulation response regulator GlnG